MGNVADEVIVEFEARLGKYEADLRRGTATFVNATGRQQQAMQQLERQISSSSSEIGSKLRGMAGVFATAFTAQKVQELADGYTRFTNQLKVAGVAGDQLGNVQEKLFGIAQKYGVQLESLGTLYSRGSQVSKELGASQAQLIQFTEGVSAALKIQGTSASEAQGALLQLSQLLASGTVHAEEFNSVNEGALPILRAVANHLDAAGGSVGKLKQLVNAQKVTSKEFFDAFLAGSAELEAQAEKSSLTIGNSFQILNNALGKFIGETDQSLSATQRISGAIIALSENLGTVTTALSAIGVVLLGRYLGPIVASTAATVAKSVADVRATLTAEALAGAESVLGAGLLGVSADANAAAASITRLAVAQGVARGAAVGAGSALLQAFGGPVGIAITGLTVGIGYMVSEQLKAEAAANDLASSIAAQTQKFDQLRQKQTEAAAAAGTMTNQHRQLQTATAALTGEVGLLAEAWARVAAEAKAAAIEEARAAANSARINYEKANAAFQTKLASNSFNGFSPIGKNPDGSDRFTVQAEAQRRRALAAANPEAQQMLAAAKNWQTAAHLWQDIKKQPLATFRQDGASGGGTGGNAQALAKHTALLADLEQLKATASGEDLAQINKKIAHEKKLIGFLQKGVSEEAATAAAAGEGSKAKKGSAAAAKAAERAAVKAREAEERASEEIQHTEIEELQARLELTTNAEDRADIQRELAQREYDLRVKQIQDDERFTEAQKQAQIKALEGLYGKQSQPSQDGDIVVTANDGGLRGAAIRKELQDRQNQQAQEQLRIEQQATEAEADVARGSKEKRRLILKALDIQQQIETALLEQAIANGQIADADKARAALRRQQGAERQKTEKDHSGPIAQFMDSIPQTADEINDALEGVAAHGLNDLSDGIADAVMGFKSLGDVVRGVVQSMLSDLIKLIAKMLVLKLLKTVLGLSGGGEVKGKADGGMVRRAIGGAIPGFAAGGLGGGMLKGPGTGLSDSIAAFGPAGPLMVADGEYILKASSARKLGPGVLNYLNQFGTLPPQARRFAGGGLPSLTLPNGTPALPGASAVSADPSFKAMIRGALADAAKMMPPVNLYPTLDPGQALRAALSSQDGRRTMFEFMSQNSGRVRKSLG